MGHGATLCALSARARGGNFPVDQRRVRAKMARQARPRFIQ